MRDPEQPLGDPYRVLGLEPGAPMAEVKRAYRQLAKAFHPDSAGEAALPRFLAIHEAYELLVTGRPRAPGPRPPRTTPAAEPWRADPDRARAARERARRRPASGGATGSTGAGGPGTGSGPGARTGPSARGARSGRTGTAGPEFGRSRSGSAASGPPGSGTRESRRRASRKATMGSTSYDEAREHTDATWSGASWYGPTSGEYWIVNPREYADPRKHGPGYQQRGGRTAVPGAGAASTGADDSGKAEFESNGAPADDPLAGRARASRGATTADRPEAEAAAGPASERDAGRWRASARPAWAAAGQEAGQPWGGQSASRDRRWPGDGGPRDPLGSLEAASRDLLGTPTDDPIRRLGLALVAWPPIGLAAAATIGDITGCSVYSAECAGSDSLLPWLAQAAILGLLLLLPPLARLFVGGTIGILLALIPITVFLLAVGAGGAPQAGFVLAFLLAAAWLIGVTFAARGATRGTPRPAS